MREFSVIGLTNGVILILSEVKDTPGVRYTELQLANERDAMMIGRTWMTSIPAPITQTPLEGLLND